MTSGKSNAQADLRSLHTFGLAAVAKSVQPIQSQADLLAFIAQYRSGAPCLILGEGSNTVFVRDQPDTHVWLMRLKGRQYLGVQGDCHVFRVAAGENWHDWVQWSVGAGYPGLENLALIPGSVGASPIQNIGAYGVELKDRVQAVHGFDLESGETRSLNVDDCAFSYRDSVFKRSLAGQFVITEVDFALPLSWQPVLSYGNLVEQVQVLGEVTPAHVMQAVIHTRESKLPDPAKLANSGSFFKNPIVASSQAKSLKEDWPQMPVFDLPDGRSKLAAGWLIDRCGLKGHRIGGVQVYEKQALVLTNTGQATSADLLRMIATIQEAVQHKFDVALEPEPSLM